MTKAEKDFNAAVWRYYEKNGRHSLPWRKTKSPYHILVSEIMLQQTQVDRVVPKYRTFLRLFPTVAALASAPLGQVLVAWQGLGYNRRAKYLHEAAKAVVAQHKGKFPRTYEALVTLPGVGAYTASAVMVFAYNAPRVLIETNVRTVFLYHFFKGTEGVSDKEILELVARTLPTERPREWYAALMDYGTYLKQLHGNQNHRSRSYKKQSIFKGSDRQLRGAVLRALAAAATGLLEEELMVVGGSGESARVRAQLERLCTEGLVVQRRNRYSLPT